MVNKSEIADLVDRLDSPDDDERRDALNRLVELGEEAVPVLNANLNLVAPDTRVPLIRALGKIGDRRSLLPLMRFVFDERGNIEESDARALAMQAVAKIGPNHDADRLFEFLLDVRDDPDPYVRGYVAEAFGRIGDPRVEPFIEDALEDEDEFVRECAQRARATLEESGENSLNSKLGGRELLEKIRMASGSELEYYINELVDRDDAFDLAVQLVREEHRDTTRGLRVLMRVDDDRARDVARRQIEGTTSDAVRAIAFRLLADYLEADASDEEVTLIERGLNNSDSYVAAAALEAAAKSGERGLVGEALDAVGGSDLERAENAARALSEGLGRGDTQMIPDLVGTLEQIRRHRRHGTDDVYITIEAFLLRGLRRLAHGKGLASRDAQEQALLSLRDAAQLRPVAVTALELLDTAVPDDGLGSVERWSGPEAVPLVELLDHPDDDISRRALDLVDRAVSAELPEIPDALANLIYAPDEVLVESVIPLLQRAGGTSAREVLQRLASHDSHDVADAAEATLEEMNADP